RRGRLRPNAAGRATPTCGRIIVMTRLFPLLIAVSLLARPAGAVAQAPADAHEMHRLHTDVAAYIAALEEPDRDAWQKAHEVMQPLALRPGPTLPDLGAGPGDFTLRLLH